MALAPGTRLGPYEILSALGAGGMGEVYRARDTKLDRDVAIKILPSHFTSDPDRLARFEREARVLASLNHPHIGAIYGLEDADGVRALVLALVDGETLADRITRGPIPVQDSVAGFPALATSPWPTTEANQRRNSDSNSALLSPESGAQLEFLPGAQKEGPRGPSEVRRHPSAHRASRWRQREGSPRILDRGSAEILIITEPLYVTI